MQVVGTREPAAASARGCSRLMTGACLAVGKDVAVVSHASALDVLGLGGVIPDAVHLTVPRSKRHLPTISGVIVHTTTRPPRPGGVIVRDAVRPTAAARAILDAAEAGTAPEQIERAISQALERGLTTAPQLEQGAPEQGRRVAQLVAGALRRVVR